MIIVGLFYYPKFIKLINERLTWIIQSKKTWQVVNFYMCGSTLRFMNYPDLSKKF